MPTIAMAATISPFDRSRRAKEPLDGFLIPGVFGDESQIRDLRKRLKDTICLDLLALPDVEMRGSVLTSMVATARILVEEIVRRRPSGSIYLIGYSFGASMALEVAVQLSDIGREVEFLCVLDGPFEPPKMTLRKNINVSPLAILKILESILIKSVSSKHPSQRAMARFFLSKTTVNYQADATRRAMLWHLRNKALTNWAPRSCAAPGLHVSTGDYGSDNKLQWIDLCPNLDHIEVSTTHKDLLKRNSLKKIVFFIESAAEKQRCLPSAFDL